MAGSFGSASDDDLISGINITPLVDVILVLLIIFMITAPVIYQSAIKVQLPQAKTGEQGAKNKFNFSVNKEGQLFWDKNPVDWADLPKRLAPFKEGISQETAMIHADKATPHGTVVQLMDALREVGLIRFALSVENNH